MISQLKLFEAGYCTHREFITIKGGSFKTTIFPAIFAYLKHETHGHILFDTGYSTEFYKATQKFPFNIYGAVTPVFIDNQVDAVAQLKEQGVEADDINYVIISHFHADHIAGLKSFQKSTFIYSKVAYDSVKGKSALGELKRGFLKSLLPEDFEVRSKQVTFDATTHLSNKCEPFKKGFDVFDDGSLLMIELEGHAKGQIGLMVQALNGQVTFLIADAAWRSESYKSLRYPHKLAYFIMADAKLYDFNLRRLHQLYQDNKDIRIIPSHCEKCLKE